MSNSYWRWPQEFRQDASCTIFQASIAVLLVEKLMFVSWREYHRSLSQQAQTAKLFTKIFDFDMLGRLSPCISWLKQNRLIMQIPADALLNQGKSCIVESRKIMCGAVVRTKMNVDPNCSHWKLDSNAQNLVCCAQQRVLQAVASCRCFSICLKGSASCRSGFFVQTVCPSTACLKLIYGLMDSNQSEPESYESESSESSSEIRWFLDNLNCHQFGSLPFPFSFPLPFPFIPMDKPSTA